MVTIIEKLKSVQKNHQSFAIIILLVILIPTTIIIADIINPNVVLGDTPGAFQPIRVASITYDVRSANGTLLGTINGSSSVRHFIDPTFHYPRVDVFSSQPFLSDCYGNPASANHAPSQRLAVGDQALFLQEYWYTIHVGVRTRPNLPGLKDTTSWLSPFATTVMSWNGYYIHAVTADEARGTLAAVWDAGTWKAGTRCAITTSLEPIDFTLAGSNSPTPRAGYTLDDARAKCQTNYGNSPVIVQPKLDIAALSNYVQYSYSVPVTLSNGTSARVEMESSSAIVGFTDAFKSGEDRGLIPSTMTPLFKNISMGIDAPTGTKMQATDLSSIDSDDANPYVNGFDAEGWIEFIGFAPDEVIGQIADVHELNVTSGIASSINLANPSTFGMPQHLILDSEFTLQPRTTIKVARTSVGWGLYCRVNQLYTPGVVNSGVDTIEYPVAILTESVYTIMSISFKVSIITENEYQVVTSTGRPIDPSELVDFDLNSIINDPSKDNVIVKVHTPVIDWAAVGGTTITIIIIVLVISGIIGIIVLFIYLRGYFGNFGMGGGGGAVPAKPKGASSTEIQLGELKFKRTTGLARTTREARTTRVTKARPTSKRR
ncbi:MAG: hypothetical protein Q6365_022595 [Candidatus Sigynarchaeota archaeon]